MAKEIYKVIDIKDGDNTILSINTKRLDAVYIEVRQIKFAFSKQIISTADYDTLRLAEETKRTFMKEWRGIE